MLSGLLLLMLASPWSDGTREAFAGACVSVFRDEETPGQFCGCLLVQAEGRITEEEFLAYARPEPSPTDDKVAALLHRAVSVCRSRAALDI